jgi:hypothetical protein
VAVTARWTSLQRFEYEMGLPSCDGRASVRLVDLRGPRGGQVANHLGQAKKIACIALPSTTNRCGSLAFPTSAHRGPVTGLNARTNDWICDAGYPTSAPPWPCLLFEALHLPGWTKPAASLGIRQYAPPSTSSRAVARTRSVATRSGSRGHREPRSVRVVSHHFDGSHRARLASVLQPAADPGVRRVSLDSTGGAPAKAGPSDRLDPHDAVRTLRRIPLVDSRTASPRPLPSCRSLRTSRGAEASRRAPPTRMGSDSPKWISTHPAVPCRNSELVRQAIATTWIPVTRYRPSQCVGFRAFLHRRVRNTVPPLPAERCPILPWALFPFKVHSKALDTRRAHLLGESPA